LVRASEPLAVQPAGRQRYYALQDQARNFAA